MLASVRRVGGGGGGHYRLLATHPTSTSIGEGGGPGLGGGGRPGDGLVQWGGGAKGEGMVGVFGGHLRGRQARIGRQGTGK